MVTTNKGALATLDHTSRTMYNFPRAAQPAVMEVDPTAVLARTATPAPPASAKITSAAELWARAPAAPAATRLVVVISAPASAKLVGVPAQSANRRRAQVVTCTVVATNALRATG